MLRAQVEILTRGWVRKELSLKLVKWMRNFPSPVEHVDIGFRELSPISHARNTIVKDFLKSSNDYLLMIDDDVVPDRNPLELIGLRRKIITCPCVIFQYKNLWNIYRTDKKGYWIPVDITKEKNDLIEVDATGTGCILLDRGVLQEIKNPFERKFNSDGIETMGLDLYFSQKAKEKGYKIFASLLHKCSHYKTINIRNYGG